jgi:hypothetical protein
MTTERQMSQLRLWANGTDFVLDPESSPKREFARLAQACGWVGGGAEWNRRWRQTFDEEYGYIPRSELPMQRQEYINNIHIIIADDSYRDNSMHRETGSHRNTDSDWDLISNEGSHSGSSDYSVIGAEGGVVLYQTPAPTVTLLNEFERLAIQNANSVEVRSTAPVSTRNRPKKPATQQNKSGMSKKQRRAQALEADFCTFFGSDLDGLDGWQKLCEIVGVSSNRKSVTQYKKVCHVLPKSVIVCY